MIKAVDLGFGQVKAMTDIKQVEYPAAIGTYRPVRFTSGLEAQDPAEKICIEFEGKKYFVGNMAITQSTPRVTMNSKRFTSQEGLALMMSALLLLADGQVEGVKLIAGLPVNEYAGLRKKYEDTLKGEHYVQRIDPSGDWGDFYRFNIEAVKILPQPIGTIFNNVLNDAGELNNKELASGRLAVLDIGKHTVDLAVTDALQFIDRSSVSYNDVGLFDAFKDISLALKGKGYDLPADSLEPYLTGSKQLKGLPELAEQAYAAQAEKIASRVLNTWPDLWSFDRIFITGGGALVLGDYISSGLGSNKIEVCQAPTFTNCKGYYKFARRLWK